MRQKEREVCGGGGGEGGGESHLCCAESDLEYAVARVKCPRAVDPPLQNSFPLSLPHSVKVFVGKTARHGMPQPRITYIMQSKHTGTQDNTHFNAFPVFRIREERQVKVAKMTQLITDR